MIELGALWIADRPSLWEGLGFALVGDAAWIDGIACCLGRPGRGVESWTLRGGDGPTELPRGDPTPPAPSGEPEHRNGVIAIDHVVITTADVGRTTASFEAAGIARRRLRATGTGDRVVHQAFFRVGRTIAEVVGPAVPAGAGSPMFSGIAFTVSDLDAAAVFLGPRLRPAKQAVQPGRRIATLDRSAGSSVPMAFMSPAPSRA